MFVEKAEFNKISLPLSGSCAFCSYSIGEILPFQKWERKDKLD